MGENKLEQNGPNSGCLASPGKNWLFPNAVILNAVIPDAETRKWVGGSRLLLLGLFFAPASEIKKQKIRKSKNGASEMISVTQHKYHRNGKWKTLKNMWRSEFAWRGNFRDRSQKCFGPRISDFPKLSVTALFWSAKGRRPLGPPNKWAQKRASA